MNKKRNRGMTMVEIIVAFVMLALVMAIMYSCIQFASNLTREAADVDRNNDRFQTAAANYFRGDSGYELDTSSDITYSFEGVNADGTKNGPYSFTIKTAIVSFRKASDNYEVTTDHSEEDVRNLYLFSTKGE